ncbi:MAG: hypothetical protein BWY85_00629 [Firmicutes bacterium ADurb.Bin506]|nr:MAG: hypothetical protein BWY85_00629 [Firmicutes bacterium ADurb.Bin506]
MADIGSLVASIGLAHMVGDYVSNSAPNCGGVYPRPPWRITRSTNRFRTSSRPTRPNKKGAPAKRAGEAGADTRRSSDVG